MDDRKSACGDCGATLPPQARFCPQCGAKVAAAPAPARPAGERRQVAILFADLAGFTRLTSEADAEEVHRLLGRYFESVDGAIARAGGSVDKHIGDATMAVFGAPVAHGNDIERAVRAACEIHEAMTKLSAEFGRTLATHIGIACGEVVAASTGSAVRADYTMTGDAVNLASRLEELAGAAETIVSDEVREALGARLDVESRGTLEVRGFARAMNVWRVLALNDATPARHRMVGRAAECALVEAAMDAARTSGRGAAFLVRADPGVGKSRFGEAVLAAAASAGCATHSTAVLDFGAARGRDAASMLARSLLGLTSASGAEACREALARARDDGRVRETDEPFVTDLLGLPHAAGGRYEAMDPATRSRGRIAALAELAVSASALRPLAILVEDLHWAEPPVLEAMAAIAQRAREHPVVLVATTRREGDAGAGRWAPGLATTIDLAPLSTDEALEVARAYLEARPDVARRCVERAQGNPLFLTQLLQSGADGEAIPGTIASVVLARLDRLPAAEKAALQAASVAGQRFDPALVAHLVGAAPPLADARARDLVRDAGAGGELAFTHALIRDGAYASLLHSVRRDLHRRAAGWFAGRDAVLRAEHLERAEDPLAAEAFLDAARSLAASHRPDEALALARRGARLASPGPVAHALATTAGTLALDLGQSAIAVESFERAHAFSSDEGERCAATIGIAAAHRLTSSWTEAARALEEAQPVAERRSMKRELARIASLRGSMHFARGDLARCAQEHQHALALAREAGDEAIEAQALSGVADALYAAGRMPSARVAFERCIALCERRGDRRAPLMNRLMLPIIDFYLGKRPASIDVFDKVRGEAREIGHRVAEVMADEAAGVVLAAAGRDAEARVVLERSLALAREISSRRFMAFDLALLARLARREGDAGRARVLLDECWAILEDVGPGLVGPLVLATRARIAGSREEMRALLDRGEALLGTGALSHNHFWYRDDAIDAWLEAGDPAEALRHADELERFASAEPVPWVDFIVARARALAAAKRGSPNAAELSRLRERGVALHVHTSIPAIDDALAGIGARG